MHIDITKSLYNTTTEGDSIDYENLINILTEMIAKVNYGGIVLLNNFEAAEDKIVYGVPIRIYNENCNSGIIELHNKMWDLQKKPVTPIIKDHL